MLSQWATIDLSLFYLFSAKYLKDLYIIDYSILLLRTKYFQSSSLDFKKTSQQSKQYQQFYLVLTWINKSKGNSSYCIFLDFAKAFDTVNHEILLGKLDYYGVSGVAHSLLSSYLSNRTQQTEINGTLSESGIIRHGVPQGSVLGPLLFLLYINDIKCNPMATGVDPTI